MPSQGPGPRGRSPRGPSPLRSTRTAPRPVAAPTGHSSRPSCGSANRRFTASAKAAGWSSIRSSRPGTARCPRHPARSRNELAFPMAMASTILRRVPPPSRSGTTTTAASARWPQVRYEAGELHRGPGQCRERWRRPAADDLAARSGCARAMRGQMSWTKWGTPSDIGISEEPEDTTVGRPAADRQARLVVVDVGCVRITAVRAAFRLADAVRLPRCKGRRHRRRHRSRLFRRSPQFASRRGDEPGRHRRGRTASPVS